MIYKGYLTVDIVKEIQRGMSEARQIRVEQRTGFLPVELVPPFSRRLE